MPALISANSFTGRYATGIVIHSLFPGNTHNGILIECRMGEVVLRSGSLYASGLCQTSALGCVLSTNRGAVCLKYGFHPVGIFTPVDIADFVLIHMQNDMTVIRQRQIVCVRRWPLRLSPMVNTYPSIAIMPVGTWGLVLFHTKSGRLFVVFAPKPVAPWFCRFHRIQKSGTGSR